MTARRTSASRKASPGLQFEQAVAALQALLDPTAEVTHNVRLTDRLGHRRQFDVVIRAKAAGHPILGVIECRDLKGPVDSPQLNALADKARNVNAQLVICFSRRGFTKPALELARFHGIGTFSLLKADHGAKGLTFGQTWYATVLHWGAMRLTLHFSQPPAVDRFSAEEVMLGETRVLDWIVSELHTRGRDLTTPGWYALWIRFTQPESCRVGDRAVSLSAIEANVELEARNKSKRILWAGQAMYDWATGSFTIPPNASLQSEVWSGDFSDWPDFEGELPPTPPTKTFLDARFTLMRVPTDLPLIPSEVRARADVSLDGVVA